MKTEIPEKLHSGKVRDTYAGEVAGTLLVVASDRISTFDAVHPTPVPGKGLVLTHVTDHWLTNTPVAEVVWNHLISTDVLALPEWAQYNGFAGRAMLVQKLKMLPVEAIVRGYLTGSGWKDYQRTGEVSGVRLPAGMVEMEHFAQPIFTPSTKAEVGHDENVDFEFMVRLLDGNRELAERVRQVSLDLYTVGADYARERGIILVDTKFEFGLNEDGELVLADEVLTPDSSRFVDIDNYEIGKPPKSMDKQYVRDWAADTGWDKKPPAPELPAEVVEGTIERYAEIAYRLTGTNPLAN
jgi:phosphoribosylaminoimidazole-succinocarboxamide synthase